MTNEHQYEPTGKYLVRVENCYGIPYGHMGGTFDSREEAEKYIEAYDSRPKTSLADIYTLEYEMRKVETFFEKLFQRVR